MKQLPNSNLVRVYGGSVLRLLELAFLGALAMTHGSVADPGGSGGGSWVARLRGGGSSGGSSDGGAESNSSSSPPYAEASGQRPYDTCVCAFDFGASMDNQVWGSW